MKGIFLRKTYKKLKKADPESFNIILGDLIAFTKYDNPSYVQGDSYQTAYNEGMKRVIMRIKKFINYTEEDMAEIEKANRKTLLEHQL